MTPLIRIVAACMLALAAAGCSTSTPPPSTPAPSAPRALAPGGPRITISALSFGAPMTVPLGTRVVVINEDDVPHTVTSMAKGKFDVRVEAHGWATFTAPSEAGKYAYYCIYHPAMLGTLIVE